MTSPLTRLGDTLALPYHLRNEDTHSRVFFTLDVAYKNPDERTVRLSTPNIKDTASAHQKIELAQFNQTLITILDDIEALVDSYPIFKANQIKPLLKMELVGMLHDTPLTVRGTIQGYGGLTQTAFTSQQYGVTTLDRNSDSYTQWAQKEETRWDEAKNLSCTDNAPYWLLYNLKRQTPHTTLLKADTEKDALGLFRLLFPRIPNDEDFIGFSRSEAIPNQMKAWT